MEPKLKLSLILAASISHACSSFFSTAVPSRNQNTRLYSDILRDGAETVTAPRENRPESKIEVWLDLRGTSITPKTALELWHSEVQDEQPNETRAPPFVKCLVSHNERDSVALSTSEVDVVMVDKEGSSFKLISDEQSASIGKIVSLEAFQSSSIPNLPDPLPLMDAYSNGQWVLLDTTKWKKIDEAEKMGSLFSLAEIITSMKPPGSCSRIGWTCHSKSEVTKSAMWMQCQGINDLSGASTKTLGSGIIIPGDFDASEKQQQHDIGAKCVITVPYDTGLLKSAMSFITSNDTDV